MRSSRPNRTRSRPRAGVSLFSILLSLCAIGLLALVAIPSYFARHDVTLDSACKLLLRDLRAAQNRTALSQGEALFTFSADGWRVTTPDGRVLTRHGSKDPLERKLGRDAVFEGVRLENVDFAGSTYLQIDERGLARQGGTLEMTFRGERRFVSIDRGTGVGVVLDQAGRVVVGDPFARSARAEIEPR
jgi:hypothetical protein